MSDAAGDIASACVGSRDAASVFASEARFTGVLPVVDMLSANLLMGEAAGTRDKLANRLSANDIWPLVTGAWGANVVA